MPSQALQAFFADLERIAFRHRLAELEQHRGKISPRFDEQLDEQPAKLIVSEDVQLQMGAAQGKREEWWQPMPAR